MRRVFLPLALVLLSAALQTVIFPVRGPLPFARAQLAWIALVPWFYLIVSTAVADRRPVLVATVWSYLCGVLWYAGHCYWIFGTMHQYGHLSIPMAALAVLLFCLYLGLYHALYGCLAALLVRLPWKAAQLMLPFLLATLWVAVELARARITSFPWDLLGYSQIDNPALMHLAPWTGTYGISFLVALSNALLACALLRTALQSSRTGLPHLPSSRLLLSAGAALAILCLTGGSALHAPKPTANHTAVLLQPNLSGDDDAEPEPRTADPSPPLANQLAAVTDRAFADQPAAQSASLVLWPEAPTPYELHEPQLQSVLTGIATLHHVTLIADSNAVDANSTIGRRYRLYNSAGLFTRDGLRGRYDKIHLVPFGEFMPYASLFTFANGLTQQVGLFDRGTRRAPLTDGAHRYGIFICYESIFSDEVRQFAKKGADVLVNLSDDGWYGDTSAPFQHSNMARMRAIENRRWLLRDTNTGITESIDPYGNVREAAPRHRQLAAVLPFAYRTDLTFYTRYGDIFAWLCTVLTLAALLGGAAQRNAGAP